MVARLLFPFSDSAALVSLTVLSIVAVAFPAVLFSFISGLWTARLKFVLIQILDFTVRVFAALQGVCALAYAVPGWSEGAYSFLRCAEHWVWIDYFDGLVEQEEGDPYDTTLPAELLSFRFDHWSRNYYGNGFTSTSFLLLAIVLTLLYLLASRLCLCVRTYFHFFQLDFLVKILQITHFRLSLSLLLEIRMLYDGRDAHWTSGTGIGFAFATTILLPVFLLLVVCFRSEKPLDSEFNLRTYGSLYREFRNPLRITHFFAVFVENLILSVTLCVIGQWPDAQAYVIVSLMALSFAHVAVFRPFRLPEHNASEGVVRLLRLCIAILLVLVYHRGDIGLDDEVQDLVCFLLVLLWLVTQLLSGALLAVVSLRHVRSFFTDEAFEDWLYEGGKREAGQVTMENAQKRSTGSPESSPLSNVSPRGEFVDVPATALPKDSQDSNTPRPKAPSSTRKKRTKGSTEG